MPKILTAGMIWTVSREKYPDPAIRIKANLGYYSESAPVTDMNSTSTMHSIRKSLFLQYPRKAGGQVTVAATVTAITVAVRRKRISPK